MAVVMRFIEDPPQEPYRRQLLVEDRVVFDWQLEDRETAANWLEAGAPRQLLVDGETAELAFDGKRLELTWPVDFEAAEVSRVEVLLANLGDPDQHVANVQFLWAGAGDQPESPRRLGAYDIDSHRIAADLLRYRLWVRGEAEWSGRINQLRVACDLRPEARIAVRGIVGYAETLPEDRLAELAQSAVQGMVGMQLRNAIPALPGFPTLRRLDVPPGAELRFGYALSQGVRSAVRFTVTATVDGQPSRALFSDQLSPREQPPRWHDAVVDLSSFVGSEISLRLETSSREPLDPAHGFPLWSNPEALAPSGTPRKATR